MKVFGNDLNEIERISVALEGMLRQIPGTRSTFAERQTGREYVDIVPKRCFQKVLENSWQSPALVADAPAERALRAS